MGVFHQSYSSQVFAARAHSWVCTHCLLQPPPLFAWVPSCWGLLVLLRIPTVPENTVGSPQGLSRTPQLSKNPAVRDETSHSPILEADTCPSSRCPTPLVLGSLHAPACLHLQAKIFLTDVKSIKSGRTVLLQVHRHLHKATGITKNQANKTPTKEVNFQDLTQKKWR